MDLEIIRKKVISALCSDDYLLNILVLKGGNALALIHGIGGRASLDIDFSISGDFEDLDNARERLFQALDRGFEKEGYLVFDKSFIKKPAKNPADPAWGGYRLEFKLILQELASELGKDPVRMQKESLAVNGPGAKRTFKVDISKHEYVTPKVEEDIDDAICYVYTLPMIAAEKLRAICQQMDEYPQVTKPRPRARDFYDIYTIIDSRALNFEKPEFLELVTEVFNAKSVPLLLLSKIHDYYDFHLQDWRSVVDSIKDESRYFQFYFDFVVKQSQKLESLWKV